MTPGASSRTLPPLSFVAIPRRLILNFNYESNMSQSHEEEREREKFISIGTRDYEPGV